MNILRKTRKSNIKITKKRCVLLIFSLIMTSFAWVAYLKILSTNSEIHINSWNISLYLDENKNGVAEATEIIDKTNNNLEIKFSDMYPGMNEEIVDVIIKNNGETPSTIDYIISDIAFLGYSYKIQDDQAVAAAESADRIIQKNEFVESAGIVSYKFIDEPEKFPFKIVIENTDCIEGGAEGHLKVKALWQSSLESNDGLTQEQIDAKNENDSAWGYGMAEFESEHPGIHPFQFKIKINATGVARSSRYVLTQKVTPENYGEFIDYPIDLNGDNDTTNDWKIFYEGNENIYIISSGYVKNTKLKNGVMKQSSYLKTYENYFDISALSANTSIAQASINKYLFTSAIKNTNNNYKAAARLLTQSNWSNFVNSQYAESAVGAPTIEMFVKSWNQKFISTNANSKLSTVWEINKEGFNIANNEMKSPAEEAIVKGYDSEKSKVYFPDHTDDSIYGNCSGYWIASPSINNQKSLITVLDSGKIGFSEIDSSNGIGIRPVVVLKAGLKGESKLNEDTGKKVWYFQD